MATRSLTTTAIPSISPVLGSAQRSSKGLRAFRLPIRATFRSIEITLARASDLLLRSTPTRCCGRRGPFYGFSSATNFQYAGTAFRRDAPIHFTNDGGITQNATLTNLFPNLAPGELPHAQGTQYGPLAQWGFVNQNDLGTTEARNPEIYQWNLGLQHLFPAGMVISIDYSANRSTHLPFGGVTRNRNVISTAARLACDTTCQNTSVANPFQSLFTGPSAIFNEPDSRYSDSTIPLVNLLRPYPQFDNNFEGLPLFTASSWYNAMLVRFQKRESHGLSFEGNYTWAKATDNSSYGANSFVFFGGSGLGSPQDLNNLKAEYSVGANDTRHRFEIAIVYDLPVGRERWLGKGMNRVLDGIVGGWSLNTLLTLQTGQPVPFAMSSPRLTDGNQRPNITCNPASGLSVHDVAMSTDPNASYYNASCLSDPEIRWRETRPVSPLMFAGRAFTTSISEFSKAFASAKE